MNADQSERRAEKRQRTHGRHLKTSLFPSSLLRKAIVDRNLSHTVQQPGRLPLMHQDAWKRFHSGSIIYVKYSLQQKDRITY